MNSLAFLLTQFNESSSAKYYIIEHMLIQASQLSEAKIVTWIETEITLSAETCLSSIDKML